MMIATRRVVTAALALALGVTTGSAYAQSAEAEMLFREGKRLLKKGEIAEACDKFEASDRLEPTAGTKLNLADCREQNGQLATAWTTFIKAASAAKRADKDGKREAEARRRAAALEPRLIYLTILVPDDNRVEGLVIKRNNREVDPELWNERVPVDPGEYAIVAEAPDHEPLNETVVMKTKNKSIAVPRLEPGKRGERPARTTRTDGEADADADEAAPVGKRKRKRARVEPRSTFTGIRTASVVFAVVGVAAIGAGAGFGIKANELAGQSDAICPNDACPDPHAVDLNASARRDALIANVGLIGGGVAIAGAAVLWFVGAPRETERVSVTPSVAADRIGLSLMGRF
jgi:hypothetical protein